MNGLEITTNLVYDILIYDTRIEAEFTIIWYKAVVYNTKLN